MERIRAESISFMLLMSTEKKFILSLSQADVVLSTHKQQICSVRFHFYNAIFITIAAFLMLIYQTFYGDQLFINLHISKPVFVNIIHDSGLAPCRPAVSIFMQVTQQKTTLWCRDVAHHRRLIRSLKTIPAQVLHLIEQVQREHACLSSYCTFGVTIEHFACHTGFRRKVH